MKARRDILEGESMELIVTPFGFQSEAIDFGELKPSRPQILESRLASLDVQLVQLTRILGALVREKGGKLIISDLMVETVEPDTVELTIEHDAKSKSHVVRLAGEA